MEIGVQYSNPASEHDRFLVSDFYLSFLFSQGRDGHQRYYFDMLAYQYDQQNVFREIVDRDIACEGLMRICKSLRVPTLHADLTNYGEENENAAVTAQKQFEKQSDVFVHKLYQDPLKRSRYRYYVKKASMLMIGMDKHYVQKGRPQLEGDKYMSVYREYILGQKKVGSLPTGQYLKICELRRHFIKIRRTFKELAEAWENVHVGEFLILNCHGYRKGV
jgi:hypothetical protein